MTYTPHPRFDAFLRTLGRFDDERVFERWEGILYRFTSPKWASPTDLISGNGGFLSAGRWLLPRITGVVNASTDAETAFQESLAETRRYGFPDHRGMPKTVVAIRAKLTCVLDLGRGDVRRRLRMSLKTIGDTDWDSLSKDGEEAITQALGRAAYGTGVEGILTPSAALAGGVNLMVFPENFRPKSSLQPLS